MFYFLLIAGAGLISFGLHLRRNELSLDLSISEDLVFNGQEKEVRVHEAHGMPEKELMLDLRHRMEELEGTLFESLMKWELERKELLERLEKEPAAAILQEAPAASLKTDATEVTEVTEAPEITGPSGNTPERKPMPDNIKAIVEYEEEGLTVQEIANITRMKKGEVLLLRSLSKHYTK